MPVTWRTLPGSGTQENEIPDAVAKPNSATLKLGERPVIRARGIIPDRSTVFESWRLRHDVHHMLGVVLPVRSHVQVAPKSKLASHELSKIRLHQTPLVVSGLRPWIRKKQVHSMQAAIGNAAREHLTGITANHAHVGRVRIFQIKQQAPNTRSVDFDPQVIALRVRDCHGTQAFAITKANF